MGKKWWHLLLLVVVLGIYSFHANSGLLVDPPPWPDEAITLDIVHNLVNHTSSGTSLWQGLMPYAEKYSLWYPGLYYRLMSWLILPFSLTLLNFRYFSLISGGLSLILVYLIGLKIFSAKLFYLPFLIDLGLALNYPFIRAARIVRPEIYCLMLLLFSCYLILFNSKKSSLFAGILTGMAAILHPLTLLFSLTSISVKSVPKLIRYWAGLASIILIWLVVSFPILKLTLTQMSLAASKKFYELPYFFLAILDEPFLVKFLYFSYIVLSLIVIFYIYRHRRFSAIVIGLALVSGWLMGFLGRMIWYWLYFLPFLYLSIGLLYQSISRKYLKWLWLFFFVILALSNYYLSLSQTKLKRQQYALLDQMMAQVKSLITPGSQVFLSAVPDPYFWLKDDKYILREFPSNPVPLTAYRQVLNQSQYAVYTQDLSPELFGLFLPQYLKDHEENIQKVSNQQGLDLYVVKLKP